MNKIKITVEDLFNLPGAVIYNPDSYITSSSVSTDTRTIKKNSIFFALKGPRFDGHNFVKQAADKGASAVVINKNRLKDFDNIDCTIVTVKNTVLSYGDLARVWRSRLRGTVIAISGSNGKTTTKEMIFTLLSKYHRVSKTISNNNNHIGVPLTIFSTDNSYDYLVLELGTNHFGEIAYTSAIALPDIAVITNIGDSHLEFLIDRSGVAKEKTALLDVTAERNGKVLLNADDPILRRKVKSYKNSVTFGFAEPAEIKGEVIKLTREGKPVIKITKGRTIIKTELPVFGTSNVKNFLIAAAVTLEAGLKKEQITKAAAAIKPVDKRLNVKEINNFTVVNDTYNANPESMKSAFEFISNFNSDRKTVAILGDMFELGAKGVEAHKALIKEIKKNRINEVYTIGKLMKNLSKELHNTKIINRHFISRDLLAEFVREHNFNNSVVLIKGSRGMKMEEFVKILEDKTE